VSPVKAADPRAAELDSAFAAAMAGPSKPKEAAAPPEIDRDAPHGRDEAGAPLEPHGRNKDGSIRRSAAGRKAKDDQARTAPAGDHTPAAPGAGKPAPPEPADFSAGLMDFAEAAWFGGSVVAKVGPRLPLVGRLVPGQKIAATMAVFDSQRPSLCMALNLAAQHDARARRLAVKLAEGEASWALTCMFMVAPFTSAVAAVWQGDKALAEREMPALAELVQANEDALDRMFSRISDQMEAARVQVQAAQAVIGTPGGDDGMPR
jgi:hypothetical protein